MAERKGTFGYRKQAHIIFAKNFISGKMSVETEI